ncbi:hypothetical protein NPIL_372831 [Nephila pilipes]|uniref:C2H2-type domain-containing protein n=1 Tax=Nephila pilipes TaxID=299642 RepID=A0A8X6NKV0_NEPPI|nr:hypothetical protein NPIL_372831 [Nephila pilipes]
MSQEGKDSTRSILDMTKDSPSPIALRTRHGNLELSYRDAAVAGKCKLCPASFGSMDRLKIHLQNHKPNHKRKKALLAIQEVNRSPDFYCSTPSSNNITTLFESFQASLRAAIPPSSSPLADPSKIISASAHESTLPRSSPEVVETRTTGTSPPRVTSPREIPSMSPTNNNISLSFSLPENITLPVCVPQDSPDQELVRVIPSTFPEFGNPSSDTSPSVHEDQVPREVVDFLLGKVSCMRDSAAVPINKEDVHVVPPLDPKVHLVQDLICSIPTTEEQQQEKAVQIQHNASETPSPAREPNTEVPLLSFDPKPKREVGASASKSPTILEMILEDPLSKDDILDSQEPPSALINTHLSSPELEELQM